MHARVEREILGRTRRKANDIELERRGTMVNASSAPGISRGMPAPINT
jgi:hypothetical protein